MSANILKRFKKNKFKVHLVAFLLMIIPPALLYFAAERGASGPIWVLLGLVIAGNILAILVR
jgi:hypothetical protein